MSRFRQESDQKFLILVIVALVLVGGSLIALIYGPVAFLTALPCLLGGAALIMVPWLLLTALEKWRRRIERADRQTLHLPDRDENDILGKTQTEDRSENRPLDDR
jgi:membrane protein implicated in regulation of membrane protease activity